MANRTIQIIIDVNDRTGGKVKGLADSLKQLDAAAQRINNRIRAIGLQRFAATIRLIDRVTEPGTRINALLKRIAGTTYRVTMSLNESVLGKIRQVESTLMRIVGKTYTIAVNVKDNVKSKLGGLMSGAAMGAGVFMPMAGMAGVGFGVANAIQASAGFEQQMSKVQAIRQLSKDSEEMKLLTQQAKDLGMQTAWTRQQVGEAQYYQALAGWSTQNILQATPHLLNMASAGGIDLGRASDIVTDAMTAFGLKATETYTNKQGQQVSATEHFIDMLTKLQASANTDISQAGEAFKYSANVIGSMFSGQSITNRMQATEDAMIMTGLMANAGIKGSMAGTATRAVFTRMASMNRNSYNALRAMGVEYKDDQGNILMPGEILRGLSKRFKEGVDPNQLLEFAETIAGEKIHADTRRKLDSFIEQTQKNGGKMGSADMAKMAAMLAGQEAMSGLLAVLMGDWDAMAEKMDNVNGTADKMAKDMLDNLAGSFVKLGSAWDAFQQDLFTGTAGDGLRGFVDTLTEVLTRANKLFQDGIHIGDFGQIIADVIDRLKNKFLEFDGIGSILAGGALVAGLTKIVSLSQRALNAIRNVGKAGAWGTAAAGAKGVAGTQAVGTMNVSAGVVNINGRVNGAIGGRKVGNTAIIDNYNRTKERIRSGVTPPPTAVPSRFAGMRSAAGGAAAFAGIFSIMDMMNLKSVNAERLAAASENERARIMAENRASETTAATGALGSIIGAAAGAAIGSAIGPVGTMIGGMIGSMAGEMGGRLVGEQAPENTPTPARANISQSIIEEQMNGGKGVHRGFDEYADITKVPKVNNWLLNPREGQNYFGMHGEDITHSLNTPARESTTLAPMPELNRGAGHKGWDMEKRMAAIDQETADFKAESLARQKSRWQKMNGQWQENDRAMDSYSQSLKDLAAIADKHGTEHGGGGDSFDDSWLNRAEAGTPTAEQMMTEGQVAMPEITPPETSPIDEWFNFEGVSERLAELGAQITEGLSVAMSGAAENVAALGESISTGLSSALEGAGEVFSGLSEMISSGLSSAQATAEGALAAIAAAFTSTKESVQSAWAELPGFFSGVFSGLGGAASAAGAAIYSGLTSVIGAVIGAWQSAAATVSSIISSIAAAASSVASMIPSIGGGGVGKAEGGFVSSETHYFAGEHGPEVIIPLGSSHRARAMDLLEKTAAILGGENFPIGADEIQSTVGEGLKDLGAPVPTTEADTPVAKNESPGTSNSISFGGITINFDISGADSPQDVVETIKENISDITDKFMSQIASQVHDVFHNQALEG